ncbi:hypothetical protein Pmani_025674 [Petrolisthes manimaculis]|uniref:Mitochondrial ribosomal protein S9 n=1 Tax=Petrolisthes manimaculis TaxID=1843537 RepID=A0AAE1U0Y3_9EUCA|nr:hypothetical protein Pmani_025674 [Petrolisthes manimaculis]
MWCVRLRQVINNTRFTTIKYIKSERWLSSESATSAAAAVTTEQQQQQQHVKVSKAMKAYQERAKAHESFMFDEWSEYEIGKRHLANIMGEDPQTFTQQDVNASIQYLLPSGLFEPLARPHLSPPTDVFAKRKEAEFDIAGRPHHTLFYTALPTFYQVMHDVTV